MTGTQPFTAAGDRRDVVTGQPPTAAEGRGGAIANRRRGAAGARGGSLPAKSRGLPPVKLPTGLTADRARDVGPIRRRPVPLPADPDWSGGTRRGLRSRAGVGERGAITLLAVACLGVLLLIGCALAVVAAMVTAHRTAQAAADLAALAGATALQDGGDPCGAAAAIAADNGAQLTGCAVDGRDVTVDVEVTGPRWLGQPHDLAASARAGPATAEVG